MATGAVALQRGDKERRRRNRRRFAPGFKQTASYGRAGEIALPPRLPWRRLGLGRAERARRGGRLAGASRSHRQNLRRGELRLH